MKWEKAIAELETKMMRKFRLYLVISFLLILTVTAASHITYSAQEDKEAPWVLITRPAPSVTTVSGVYMIHARIDDNVGVVKIELWIDGDNVDIVTLSPPIKKSSLYKREWDTQAYPNGDYKITVNAQDAAGNSEFDNRWVRVVRPSWWQQIFAYMIVNPGIVAAIITAIIGPILVIIVKRRLGAGR